MTTTPAAIDRSRYLQIIRFFVGVILHVVWWDILLRRIMPRGARRTRPDRLGRIARRFREMAVEMGGVMIKTGQFLSSRVDVLPAEITEELAWLQDEVTPETLDSIRQVFGEEFGRPPETIFVSFEEEPQAAASLGQTHRAWLLLDGGRQAVIVKVQRPGIVQTVETDLSALRVVARWVMLYRPIRRRADVPALVEEFARTTWEELDYLAEADNAVRFREMFAGDPAVCIPAVYGEFSTRRVLTLEDVEQIKITDLAAIEASGVSCPEVAKRVMDVYLRQIFEEGFFHADPHPGNLFVRPVGEQPVDGTGRPFQLVFVDFGMVGRIPPSIADQLEEIILALALRDPHRLVGACEKLGFILPSADLERVEEAVALMLDQFWGTSMEQLTRIDHTQMREFASEFRDLLFELPFQVPQDFIFLGRAIGILSGLATSLDPQFNPWQLVESYSKRLLDDRRRWPGVQRTIHAIGETVRPLLTLPIHLETLLLRANRGDLKLRVAPDRSLERQLRQIELAARRMVWGIVFAVLLVSGTLLYVNEEAALGRIGWGLAGITLLWLIISGVQHQGGRH